MKIPELVEDIILVDEAVRISARSTDANQTEFPDDLFDIDALPQPWPKRPSLDEMDRRSRFSGLRDDNGKDNNKENSNDNSKNNSNDDAQNSHTSIENRNDNNRPDNNSNITDNSSNIIYSLPGVPKDSSRSAPQRSLSWISSFPAFLRMAAIPSSSASSFRFRFGLDGSVDPFCC